MPKQQELNVLAKAIESGDGVMFDTLVWKNPRYLISAADAPVILKPGARSLLVVYINVNKSYR